MVLARPAMRDVAGRLGVPLGRFRLIGLLELAGAVGLLVGLAWSPLGQAAAAGLALLTVGAAVTHVRAGDPWREAAPAVVCCALAVATGLLV